jgi:hypothetical protein
MTVKGSPFIMNEIAQHTMDTIFYHKQRYAKLKHESLAKDDVITRLKQDIVDLQDTLDGVITCLKQDIVDLQDALKDAEQFHCGWCADDVMHRASQMEVKITQREAEEIIDSVAHNHDATIGVSWDTIEWAIEDHVSRRDGEVETPEFDLTGNIVE